MPKRIFVAIVLLAIGTLVTSVLAQAPPNEGALTRTRYLPEYTSSGETSMNGYISVRR